MNYIYDVTLNLNKELYNFYEWDENDNIEYYLKVPVFKVENNILKDFINNKIIIDKNFLNKICNKSDIYRKSNNSKYLAIFSTLDKSVAISFDNHGNSVLKSYLSLEEESDLLEFCKLIKYSLIEYKIKEKSKYNIKYLTRKEMLLKKKILESIEKIYRSNDIYKLRYIFYELYNEKPSDDKKVYYKLINLVENNSDKLYKIDSIFQNIKTSIKST